MRPARTSDTAFRRPEYRPPSRPRFAATGPRPRGVPSTAELAERMMIDRVVREARHRAGLPLQEVAGLLGIGNATPSRWERGLEPIPAARRTQLADLYGFDLSLIAGLDAEGVALTPDERTLLAAFRHLPESERRALLELVRP
ncbi:helix-turn-helix domain-containing protein [Methylobacterium sp. P31]